MSAANTIHATPSIVRQLDLAQRVKDLVFLLLGLGFEWAIEFLEQKLDDLPTILAALQVRAKEAAGDALDNATDALEEVTNWDINGDGRVGGE